MSDEESVSSQQRGSALEDGRLPSPRLRRPMRSPRRDVNEIGLLDTGHVEMKSTRRNTDEVDDITSNKSTRKKSENNDNDNDNDNDSYNDDQSNNDDVKSNNSGKHNNDNDNDNEDSKSNSPANDVPSLQVVWFVAPWLGS